MSGTIGSPTILVSPVNGSSWRNDDSLQDPSYRMTMPGTYGIGDMRDVDMAWPRSSWAGAEGTNAAVFDNMHQYWEWPLAMTGVYVRKKVIGVTVNTVGAIVPGVTVWLFNTATGTRVDVQTSDAAGNYTCSDPNAVACIAVGYLTNAPDTSGTTLDTVVGV